MAELGGPNVLLQFGAMGSERTPYIVQADGRLFLLTVLKRSGERPAGFDEIAKFVQHQFLEEAKLAAATKVKRQLRSQLNVRLIHENKAFRTAATARNAQRK